MKVDAIVNSADPKPIVGGGVDGAIHHAAGPRLREARERIGSIPTGDARITPAFDLAAKFVIHTVGPVWKGGNAGEAGLLKKAYRNSLDLAQANHCESIAFPMISTGAYGFPRGSAIEIAESTIREFLVDHDMLVYLVVFGHESFAIAEQRLGPITAFIDDRYSDLHISPHRILRAEGGSNAKILKADETDQAFYSSLKLTSDFSKEADFPIGETFAVALSRMIEEKGMKPAEAYKRANIDKRLFVKIQGNIHYQPSKTTAIAFAIALRLDYDQTQAFIGKAGFTLSDASKFDLIIEYHLRKGIYDIYEINNILFHYHQPQLGSLAKD